MSGMDWNVFLLEERL